MRFTMDATTCCTNSVAPFERRPARDERHAALCKALAHPHRVHILRFLAPQSACFAGAHGGALTTQEGP